MWHAHRLLPKGQWSREQCRATVTLAFEERYRRRLRLTADSGEAFLLDLENATVLADGDGLVLDEGGIVAVCAATEDLVEVKAPVDRLARIAWHIGNRHFPAEIREDRILMRDDHVLVAMVEGLGATVRRVRGPFNPEGGAYADNGHSHEHGYAHDH